MMAMRKVELNLNVPDGWEVDGYRVPMAGEHYLSSICQPELCHGGAFTPMMILKRVNGQYREPVLPSDYGRNVEFSDDGIVWMPGYLAGWRGTDGNDFPWLSTDGVIYQHCRIEVEAQ